MRFVETALPGVLVIELDEKADERGFFATAFSRSEFDARGLESPVEQLAVSYSRRKGTLRGIHYQIPPHEEAKLARVIRGSVFDVLVDVRPGSPTRGRWISLELTARDRRAVYIPRGVAHGFQTLEDDTEVLYQISTPYRVEATRGFRWDDPGLAIPWPEGPRTISKRDLELGTWEAA